MLNWPSKKSAEVYNYRWDVQLDAGDTVVAANISLLSGDAHIDSQTSDAAGVTIFLSGGSVGTNIFVALATTAAGIKPEQFIALDVVADDVPEPVQPASGAAIFDYTAWAALFPELATGGVNNAVASSFFDVAGLLFDNSACSQVFNPSTRLTMLNYIVAHLASLGGYPIGPGASTPAPTGVVGRISSATEGSVSVSSDYGAVSNSQAWWAQTQYGATFWQLTRGLRTMRYRSAPPRNFGPRFGLYPGAFGGRG